MQKTEIKNIEDALNLVIKASEIIGNTGRCTNNGIDWWIAREEATAYILKQAKRYKL